jgi:hypothetical protein
VVEFIYIDLFKDNPYEVMKALANEGIEAYQGATQLRTVYKTTTSKETKDMSSTEQHNEETFANKLLPSQDLHTSNNLNTTPEVAAGISQSFSSPSYYSDSLMTSNMTQQSFSAANSSSSYTSSTMFIEKDRKSCEGNTKQNAACMEKNSKDILYPYNAEYLIDHVLYLPVHKRVPLWYLEYLCITLEKVMKDRPGVKFRNGKKNIILPSKL